MADLSVAEQPPLDLCMNDFSTEFDNLPIPSMDALFFSDNNDPIHSQAFASDQELSLDFGENGDFEITFDDLDDLCIPSETEDFLLPDGHNPDNGSIMQPGSAPVAMNYDQNVANSQSPQSGTDALSGCRSSEVDGFLNLQPTDFASGKREQSPVVSMDNSGDQSDLQSFDQSDLQSNDVKVSASESPESDRESSGGPVSSQGSGNGGSGVYEAISSRSSQESGPYERDISSRVTLDQNVKLGEMGKIGDLKRKKVQTEGNPEVRTTKYRRSLVPMEDAAAQSPLDDEDEKRKARLMRNRESAQLSRQRKKHYVDELEEKVRSMHSTITELSSKISFVMAENATLRQQLSGGGICPPPPPGMYPHPPIGPMPYPWMPCAPYVVKPQGSQVPLVPIPRLKSQQPVSAPKTKKSETKKSESKTKKVASISFLGLFFFIFLFGGLIPLVNVNYGGLRDDVPSGSSYLSDRFYGQHGGKFWHANDHRNGSERDEGAGFSSGRIVVFDKINYERGRKLEVLKRQDPQHRSDSDEFMHLDNSSGPLVASLYVPRNDKMVKIDGNLIIHSILASEKAMASQTAHPKKDKTETGLALSKDWDSALAIPDVGRNRDRHPHLYRIPPEQRKALASGSAETLKDHIKSTATDGKMQQWFREGLAGPMLSSGMCTEVFQFDVSPAPGAIVPASSVSNVSAENRQNTSTPGKNRNRRILHKPADSHAGSTFNITEENVVGSSQNGTIHGDKSSSSMVVSVLVDPKEAGDGDVDGMIKPPKSLSRIFVVVLIDSVKYVTYSCGLPRVSPPFVTA